MMSPQTSEANYYYLVPNLRALDPAARELDLDAHAWVQPTVIEDEDLTFGGKSLSAWYEEERRRLSSSAAASDDDSRSGHHHHHHHHHHPSSHSHDHDQPSSHDEEHRGRERTRRRQQKDHAAKGHHK